MAIVEANPNLGAQIVADAKEYVLYSWSVQDQINPIAVAGAEGRHFWDYDGKRYLDFASQLVNVNIGHQHPKIIQAIKDQADQLCTIGPPMANESRSRLGRMLAEVTPGDLSVSFFTNGGAEANENAVKLARLVTGPQQDHRALPLVPRRDERRRHADGRPAPLGGRARHARRRADVRPVHVPLSRRPSRPVPCLHGRTAPRGDPRVRGRAHGRRRDPRDRHRDERDHPAARRLPPRDPRGLRPPRDPAHPRRGDGGLREDGSLVRLRALGRRPRHHHGREGDQLGLRPDRRDDRARRDRRPGAQPVLPRRADVRRPSARVCVRGRVDRGVPGGGRRRERRRRRRVPRRVAARPRRRHPSIGDVRGLGCFWGVELVRNRETQGDARPVQRLGGGCGAGRAGWRRRRSTRAST